jgi:uncharacterized cysteine cluster protein YcgN (CxxCxxCC family)
MPEPFWSSKPLEALSDAEWEALCDGCAQCCLITLEDAADGRIGYTHIACRLLDLDRCRCRHYAERRSHVPECLRMDAASIDALYWLPETCAYRLRAQGRPLPDWHHLVCGDREAVHAAGVSVRGRAVSQTHVHPDDVAAQVVRWVEPMTGR